MPSTLKAINSANDVLKSLELAEESLLDRYGDKDICREFCNDYPFIFRLVFNDNIRKLGLGDPQGSARRKFDILIQALRHEVFDPQRDRMASSDIVFLTPTVGRRFKEQGRWVDGIVRAVNESEVVTKNRLTTLHLELPAFGDYRVPKAGKSIFLGLPEIAYRARQRLRTAGTSVQYSEINVFRQEVERQGLSVAAISEPALSRSLDYMTVRTAAFRQDLERVGPKLVLTYPWYGTVNMALVRAANSLRIPTVDIQHGVQGRYHAAYRKWPGFCIQSDLFPDSFWVWQEADQEWLQSWIGPRRRATVTGIPWHGVAFSPTNTDPEILALYERIAGANKSGKRMVLVTLQPFPAKFLGWLKPLLRSPEAQGYVWAIRNHPGYRSGLQEVAETFQDNPDILPLQEVMSAPLAALLERSSAHVTDYSSVVQEAALMGITSFFRSSDDLYAAEVAQGLAVPIKDDAEFWSMLNGVRRRPVRADNDASKLLEAALQEIFIP